jgi:hypothetical protein
MSEDADLGVCENETADEIVLQVTFDGPTEWFRHETSPRFARDFVLLEAEFKIFFCNERLQHRVPGMLGKNARQLIKFLHPFVLATVARELEDRLFADPFVHVTEKKAAVPAIPDIGVKEPVVRRRSSSFNPRSRMIFSGKRLTR